MKKVLKYILVSFLILIVAIVTALIIFARTHQESIHQEVVNYLNREFKGKVTFQDFSLSFVSSFPRAHVELMGISYREDTTEILHIGDVDVMLNMRAVLHKKLLIEKLVIRDAFLSSSVDSLGNKSRLFAAKENTGDSVNNDIMFEIRTIEIYDSRLFFSNEIKNNRSEFRIFSSNLKLNTADSLITITGKLEGQIDSLIANGNALFVNQPVKAKGLKLIINKASGLKELVEGTLTVHTVELEPYLSLKPHEDGNLIDLKLSGENNFDQMLGLFEFHLGIDLVQVNPDASLKIAYHQQGFVNPFKRPYSEIVFEVTDAIFEGESLPLPVELRIARGNYNNGPSHSPATVQLEMDTLFAAVKESFIHGHFSLINLKDPYIHAHIESSVDLEHLFKPSANFTLAGIINLNLDIDGKINELRKLHLEGKQNARAEISVKDLAIIFNDQDYAIEMVNGSSLLTNHILEVKTLIGEFNKSAFHFKGHFENLDQFFMNDNESLAGRFNIDFKELDLTKLKFTPESDKHGKHSSFLPFSKVALDIGIKGQKIITGFGTFEQVAAKCHFEDDHLNISSLSVNYQQGKIEGTANLSFDNSGIRTLDARLDGRFRKLDLNFLNPPVTKDTGGQKTMTLPDHTLVNINLSCDVVSYRDATITGLHTGFFMNENRVEVRDFHCNLPFGTLDAEISIDDYMEADRRYSGNATFNIDSVDVESVLALEAMAVMVSPSKSSERQRNNIRKLPENIKFKTHINAGRILYQDLKINDLALVVNYNDETIGLEKLNFGFAGGKVEINGNLQRLSPADSPGYIYLNTTNIDLGELLQSFGNFGQTSFTAENTEGKISTASHHYFQLDEDLTIKKSGNFWLGNILIDHAEFDRVEPIENTLSFVGHKSRDTMIVSELNLNILLAEDHLYVRDLVMNDNIANLALSGKVNVSQRELDLIIEVSLTDLLFKSKKKRIAETNEGIYTLEDDARVFLTLSGPLSKPKPKVINLKKFNQGREDLLESVSDAQKDFKSSRANSE